MTCSLSLSLSLPPSSFSLSCSSNQQPAVPFVPYPLSVQYTAMGGFASGKRTEGAFSNFSDEKEQSPARQPDTQRSEIDQNAATLLLKEIVQHSRHGPPRRV